MPEDKVVATYEEGLEAGYTGTTPDPLPNEAYTVIGVTSSDDAARQDRKVAHPGGRDESAEEPPARPAKAAATKKTG